MKRNNNNDGCDNINKYNSKKENCIYNGNNNFNSNIIIIIIIIIIMIIIIIIIIHVGLFH